MSVISRRSLDESGVQAPDRPDGLAVVALILTAASCTAVGLLGVSPLILVSILTWSALLLFALPLSWLPSLALALFAMLPTGYLLVLEESTRLYLSPSTAVMCIWSVRCLCGPPGRRVRHRMIAALAAAFVGLSALSILGSFSVNQSVAWTANVAVLVAAPIVLAHRAPLRTGANLRRTLEALGVALGALAIVEKVAGVHVLGDLIPYGDLDITVTWLTDRATTLLGHPLMNATFFAVVTSTVIMRLLAEPRLSTAFIALVPGAGLLLSVSRAGVAAAVGAMVVGFLFEMTQRRVSLGARVMGLGAIAVTSAVLALSPLLAERGREGTVSTEVRYKVVDLALRIVESDRYQGSGAGTSNGRAVAAGSPFPIENSYLCILISLGIAGTLITLALLVASIVAAFRAGAIAAATGMVCFCIVCGAWPVWDNRPVVWTLFGALVLMAFAQPDTGMDPLPDAERPTVGRDLGDTPAERAGRGRS